MVFSPLSNLSSIHVLYFHSIANLYKKNVEAHKRWMLKLIRGMERELWLKLPSHVEITTIYVIKLNEDVLPESVGKWSREIHEDYSPISTDTWFKAVLFGSKLGAGETGIASKSIPRGRMFWIAKWFWSRTCHSTNSTKRIEGLGIKLNSATEKLVRNKSCIIDWKK